MARSGQKHRARVAFARRSRRPHLEPLAPALGSAITHSKRVPSLPNRVRTPPQIAAPQSPPRAVGTQPSLVRPIARRALRGHCHSFWRGSQARSACLTRESADRRGVSGSVLPAAAPRTTPGLPPRGGEAAHGLPAAQTAVAARVPPAHNLNAITTCARQACAATAREPGTVRQPSVRARPCLSRCAIAPAGNSRAAVAE
ncbi:hypothetical protein OBBRIDRAFT_112812 [Obba rivulosa]|uniref:Uncharacterized protein n=1 Tax=Obba rivulosa TaxID=1052685 RepID=A0A8E2DHD7_9APHY|nr:hypothetical protein OBBRIDRAFT_112812 [Obba rivulosa]